VIGAVLMLAGGIALLWISAEGLVRGASTLGRMAGIPAIVIGLTIVSIGTSAPELVVSLLAALRGSPDLAAGNVLGSNLANIGLILGLAALLRPLDISLQVIRREVPWMIGITILTLPLLWNLRAGRLEGAIMAALLFVYLVLLVRMTKAEEPTAAVEFPFPEVGRPRGGWVPLLMVAGGVLGLVLGGQGIVAGATMLAAAAGIPEVIVGLSVVAVGTSLPELATTVIAAIRREADLAVGNIVGSNIFNLTFVLGGTALVHPISIDPLLLRVEYPAVLVMTLFLLPLISTRRNLGRWEGAMLLGLYAAAWGWILISR